jgi:two-component system cell cycle sensor histidine kinase/response regulator CckA
MEERQMLTRLMRAVDASSDVIFVTDTHGVITFVNTQFTTVYGYGRDEVVGRLTPRILKSGMHSRQHYEQFWNDLTDGRSVSGRMVNRAKDGHLVEIEASANPILEDGAITGFVAVQRDVTSQHTLEDRHRLAQFASDEAADGILWIRHDSRIQYANQAAAKMLGYSREELCAMRASDIAPLFTPARFSEHFRDHFATGVARLETTLRRHDGSEFPADIAISYREFEDQRTSCAIVRDLTEHRRLHAELQQAQKMEVIGRLAGGIAHDFNNLLTVITGYGQLALEQAQGQAGLAGDIEQIQQAAERAGRLTRQLLAFSRKQVLAPKIIDVNQAVRAVCPMAARVMGVDVHLDLAMEAARPTVKLDPSQLEQLVMNLLVNARDAMPKGGQVTITSANVELDAAFVENHPGATAGPHVALAVADTGSGMSPEVLDRAVEPFFTTKPQGKGTGLGLSTVWRIVTDSGGCVVIESGIGTGTTVTSYFPAAHDPAESGADLLPAVTSVAGHETVLLVEDEAAIRALAARVLNRYGYTVLPARDGAEGLRLEADHPAPIDLLLTDVLMPNLSGPDLAQRLVRRRPAMKVLYMSGFAHQMAVASRLVGRQTGFLQKPFTPEVLAATVREMLDRQPDRVAPAASFQTGADG